MVYNKSFVQLTLVELIRNYSKNDDKPRSYARFLNLARSLFEKRESEELKGKIAEIEEKYNLKLGSLENYVYKMRFDNFGKRLIIRTRVENGNGEGWDSYEKAEVNYLQAENDLNNLVLWCLRKLHDLAVRSNIDFEGIPEIDRITKSYV